MRIQRAVCIPPDIPLKISPMAPLKTGRASMAIVGANEHVSYRTRRLEPPSNVDLEAAPIGEYRRYQQPMNRRSDRSENRQVLIVASLLAQALSEIRSTPRLWNSLRCPVCDRTRLVMTRKTYRTTT